MMCYRMLAWGFGVALTALAGRAEAGWVIDQVVRGEGGGSRMQALIQANRIKNVMQGPDGGPAMAFIMDLNAETIAQVDHQGRRYRVATFQEYAQALRGVTQAVGGQLAEAMRQMREAMKDMPPEQRQAMEQMLRSQMGQAGGAPQECQEPRREVRRTGQRATIAGYAAERHDVLADGAPESEVWLAAAIDAWREVDLQKLERFAAEMAKAMPGCGKGLARFPGTDPAWRLANQGYPMRTVHHGAKGTTTEVTKAERRSIPAAEFQPPPGFARTTLQEMLGGR